ncbi:pirin-like C-terminal cupin domain-containing protein [Polaromonas glacialis]|uniref:pirin-like C-terminal cupin domain-containing protein n=1 Tax=Polaromonas glacialis TaxID=866564 RepID=UPI001E400057|nr:pirin-like C-terminal cupin domain-containing protein [Polaromonas glacialis]
MVQTSAVQVRVLVGEAFGVRSPVRTASPTLYLDVQLPAGVEWALPPLAAEMAVYSPEQTLFINGQSISAQEMAVLPAASVVKVQTGPKGARLVVIGGAALEQPVRMWWNFVATDRARIAQAAQRWSEGGFEPIAGEMDRVAAPPWRD